MRSLVFLEDELSPAVPELEGGGQRGSARRRAHRRRVPRDRLRPGDDHVDKLLDALGFALAGGTAPSRSPGGATATPTSWSTRRPATSSRRGPRHRARRLGTARSRPSPPGRGRCCGRRSDTTRGAGEAMLPGITSPSGLHVFVSDTPGHHDHWQGDFVPTGAGGSRRRERPRPPRHLGLAALSSTRRWPSSGPCSASSPEHPRSSWSRTGGCAASRCARRGRRAHRPQRHRGVARARRTRTASPRWRCGATTWRARSPGCARAACR